MSARVNPYQTDYHKGQWCIHLHERLCQEGYCFNCQIQSDWDEVQHQLGLVCHELELASLERLWHGHD